MNRVAWILAAVTAVGCLLRVAAQEREVDPRPPAANPPPAGGSAEPSKAAPVADPEAETKAEADPPEPLGISTDPPPDPEATPKAEATPAVNMPAPDRKLDLEASLERGFTLATEDNEFRLEFHQLTHIDGRFFEQGDQRPVVDTFAMPRQWLIFSGTLGKPYEYFVAVAHGLDNYSLLDAYVNFHWVDQIQFKLGRFKTPFTYEFFGESIDGLVTPERSLFFNNYGLNRDLGAMLWGTVWNKRIDWAFGVFNGTQNSFIDLNDGKDVAAYLNVRPFGGTGVDALEYLNLGVSAFGGNELQPVRPTSLRLLAPLPGNAATGVPFLTFGPDVVEFGDRGYGSVHLAWFCGPTSIIGEYQWGATHYARQQDGLILPRSRVPVQSGYIQAATFLTGETLTRRGLVQPRDPFDLRAGRGGLGALEAFGRYNLLDVDRAVFDEGFADPTEWTNQVQAIDLGVNWYWTRNVRWSFTWEHADFGDPVVFNPAKRRQLTSDEFIVRCQFVF